MLNNNIFLICISLVWVYLVIGVLLLKWAYSGNKHVLNRQSVGLKLGWLLANSIVILFWPSLVLLGVIIGIKDTFRKI